jgi:hypothetical protein
MRPKSRHSRSLTSAIWLTAGAAAGIIVGVALADRSRVARTAGDRLRGLLRTLGGLVGRAERAMSEADDDAVDDGLDEDEGSDTIPADEPPGLDARVLAAYEEDPILSRRAIEIDSPSEGTIMLTGRVPSERDVAHAVTIARGTPGVERVEHRLRVRPARGHTSGTGTGA